LRAPETIAAHRAPLLPLLAKEIREIITGRALWILLLLLCPLVGYSFFQAVSLYAESSTAALQSSVLAASLSPLDGVLVPTFGASYVATTLLFPFVAIRVLGQEKESGTLRLLVQLPYRTSTLTAAKLAAIFAAVVLVSLPAVTALAIWTSLGGHLSAPETSNLVLGHLLYGLLVGSIALFAAAVTDSSATAAIIALAFTIGSWVLDFTIAGRPGILEWLACLSLTQILRTFEQGLLAPGLVLGVVAAIAGFATLAGIWLLPGVAARVKLARSTVCVLAAVVVLALIAQIGFSRDVTEDRRNSFPSADARALAKLSEPLRVSVNLAPEDPRFIDLQRNVLSKLERAVPDVEIRIAAARKPIATGTGDEGYGQIEFVYGARTDVTRSTSPRENSAAALRPGASFGAAARPGRRLPGLPTGGRCLAHAAVFLRRASPRDCVFVVAQPTAARSDVCLHTGDDK
jgi:ABC-type transport system involved in multi-copper enzyme maturation permease subunit